MPTQWPHVKQWLVDTAIGLPAFADADVAAGIQATYSAASKYMAVGAVMNEDNAGTFQRQQVYDGSVWSETGEVRSLVVAQSGDADGSQQETAAFAMVEALDAAIHADRRLGGLLSADAEVRTSTDVLVISNADGTATALVHVLTYTTTT